MQENVVSNEEVREVLAADPASEFHNLSGPAPDPVQPEGEASTSGEEAPGEVKSQERDET